MDLVVDCCLYPAAILDSDEWSGFEWLLSRANLRPRIGLIPGTGRRSIEVFLEYMCTRCARHLRPLQILVLAVPTVAILLATIANGLAAANHVIYQIGVASDCYFFASFACFVAPVVTTPVIVPDCSRF